MQQSDFSDGVARYVTDVVDVKVSEKTVKRRYLSGRLRLSGEGGAESGNYSDPADAPTPISD